MRFLKFFFVVLPIFAENNNFHFWIDTFALNKGIIFYPQYSYELNTNIGKFNGYGFIESTPGEQSFANNLFVYTPKGTRNIFSIHNEIGGFLFHNKYFFQSGPRVNIGNIKTNKIISNMFITFLPKFYGIRPNNVLIAGSTKPLIYKNNNFWLEGYRRFSSGGDYAEYWLLYSREKSKVGYGALIHRNGKNSYIGYGIRLNIF